MQAEIITIGTELLLGRIANTNAQFLAGKMADMGVDVKYQTVVGDNPSHIAEALTVASRRNDLIIMTGGLGPTQDDMTKQTVADYLGTKLIIDDHQLAEIKAHFDRQNRRFLESNVIQAMYLEGGQILENDNGLALGDFFQNANGADIALLPGPPSEMRTMFPKLAKNMESAYHLSTKLVTRVLKFYGISESQLMGGLDNLIQAARFVSVGSYAKFNEIWLRLTVMDDGSDAPIAELDEMVSDIQDRYPDFCFAADSELTLPAVVVELLKQKGLKVTAAESLTGGMFQSEICSVPGASNAFDGGFVTYANRAKIELLKIPAKVVDKYGVVSQKIAEEMASQSRTQMQVDFGVSFTGVAGPDSLEDQPAGTVWIGIATPEKTFAKKFVFSALAGRKVVREKSVLAGLRLLWLELKK